MIEWEIYIFMSTAQKSVQSPGTDALIGSGYKTFADELVASPSEELHDTLDNGNKSITVKESSIVVIFQTC